MNVEVLISCMQQDVCALIKRTGVVGCGVVINQCDNDNKYNIGAVTVIDTPERGLSRSRNMALRNASGDICLICDDDEILDKDYSSKIQKNFDDNPAAQVIAFQISDAGKIYPKRKRKIGYIGALKLASWQLAFRRKDIIDKGIKFDETLGSGVSKAGGEENMFLYDCLKNGLRIVFVPVTIGRMIENESKWFHGFTPDYFHDRGIMTRKLMGRFSATLYAIYFLIRKYSLYRKDVDVIVAAKKMLASIYNNE